ncbi:type II secretion system protein [Butyrivibrio sp. AE3004]|uniref:type II secretion system protein n=1 Tax=Butyrivibrio sp. AE3004 TaxID=1506994 RepID=UPI000494029C|nr:prepilin-type N-terminal cleavage/methylation domain-containing protein [Butyrivibrio sp. AE3004]
MFKKAAVYIKEKINKNGFTFAEMLFAVLILGIATGLMVQTVGVAFNNFGKITKKSDSADAYSGASTNGELYVYSDYSASGESADTDSVKYYPLVAHASYAPQNRVGVNTHLCCSCQ